MPRCAALVLVLALVACNAEAETPVPRVTDLEWETLAPMPTPRTEVAAAAVGGRIVVVGGFASAGTVGTTEVYDVAADAWSAGPDLPVAVNHAMATSFEDEAYVFGGTLGDGAISDAAFVLSDGAWEPLPLMPEPRTAGVAAFDDRVYAVGGRAGSLAGFGDVEVLDPGTGSWSPLPDLPTPRGGMAAAATSNGFVMAAGGEEEGGTFDEVEAFDVEAERWVALPPMPTARHGLGVVGIGATVYVIAGGVDPGLSFSGAVEAIDLARL